MTEWERITGDMRAAMADVPEEQVVHVLAAVAQHWCDEDQLWHLASLIEGLACDVDGSMDAEDYSR